MKKVFLVFALAMGLSLAACGDSGNNNNNNNQDGDGDDTPTCFEGTPTTNAEIITACTGDAVVAIDFNPTIKHLNADGSLPTPPDPLP